MNKLPEFTFTEPALQVKIARLQPNPDTARLAQAQAAVAASPQVRGLLAARQPDGTLPPHPYQKWHGAHWVLSILADLGYPPGDRSLQPLLEQTLDWLYSPTHLKSIRSINGRVRRCASQEGNALYSALALGLEHPRLDDLARRLLDWQWPDGGWNCDRIPTADTSSFMETLIPLRALNQYARRSSDPAAARAVERASEVFLSRRLFRRIADGTVMDPHFVRLHYPCFWHYDILFGLKVLAEVGLLGDRRCAEALALLESKRLPEGGFPAEERYYTVHPAQAENKSNSSPVSWGSVSKKQANEFVTADACFVLESARMN